MSTVIPRPDIDKGPTFIRISWILYAIATIIVAGRLYAQIKITRQLGLGDALMAGALICGITATACLTEANKWGFGRHFFYLTPEERVMSQYYTYINEPVGIASSALGRLSFMVLLWKLFGTTRTRHWILIFLAGQTIIINFVTGILIFAQCKDTRSLWDPINHPSECWSPLAQEYIGFFQGSCNSATDLTLTIIPLLIFPGLHMDLKNKFALAGLLSLSIFAFAASVVKVILSKSLGERSDYTFNTVPLFLWINVENAFVIAAASIPLLRPIFLKVIKKPITTYRMDPYGGLSSRKFPSKHYELSSVEGNQYLRHEGDGGGSFPVIVVGDGGSSKEHILSVVAAGSNVSLKSGDGSGGGIGSGSGRECVTGIIKQTEFFVQYDDVETLSYGGVGSVVTVRKETWQD